MSVNSPGTPPDQGGRHRDPTPRHHPRPLLLPWLRNLGHGILRYRPSTWRDILLGAFLVVVGTAALRGDRGAWERLALVAIGLLGLLWIVVTARQYVTEPRKRGRSGAGCG